MHNSPTIIPKSLASGSTIGIVAPSGRIDNKELFEQSIRLLHELGFKTKFPRQLWPGQEYLADNDHNRIEEFRNMCHDPETDCIMAARGGFGCLRIAGKIMESDLGHTPKRFLGFSDITLLHSIFQTHRNWVTFHGPVVTSLPYLSRESLSSLQNMLFSSLDSWKFKASTVEVLQKGTVLQGYTTGGNLSSIVSTLGTILEPSWDKKIVFLEDTSEPPYRIDRMLTQLQMCGKFAHVAAIILGDFAHGLRLSDADSINHHESIWNRVLELSDPSTSVWGSFPIGHGENNITIPLGLHVALDNERRTLVRNE